jgi:hypothetical protein
MTDVRNKREKTGGRRLRPLLLALGAAALIAPAAAQGPSLAMLAGLQDGLWEVRARDGSPPRRICVRAGLELIQLQHRESGCSRFVVDDTASEVTVQYTCRGNGYGRTNVRRETAGLVQINTQGIEGGMPFQFAAEARRTGPCR